MVLAGMLLWACGRGEIIDTGPKAQQAITIVKAYKPEGSIYTVVSNVDRMALEGLQANDEWQLGPWEAGLPSQKDFLLDRLSEYFTFVRPTGNYWVRFTYKDKAGTHAALWKTNVYTRKVEAQNDEARQFILPGSQASG
jgi:hypothetical protein